MEKTILLNKGQTIKLEVSLEINPEVKNKIIKIINNYVKKNSNNFKFEIKNLKIENQTAIVYLEPLEAREDGVSIELKKMVIGM